MLIDMSGQTPDIDFMKDTVMDRKTGRLEARISERQKSLIEKAAAYEGRSVSEFVVQSAQRAAEEVVRRHEVWELNAQQSRAFVDSLLKPKKGNKRLRDAVRDHRKTVKVG